MRDAHDGTVDTLQAIFEHNRNWADRMRKADPSVFDRTGTVQRPRCLWIGCSDSRVVPNAVTGLGIGELFVHRNIGNVVPVGDVGVGAVLEFAVQVLKVRHVIVCGHTDCGAARAALAAPQPRALEQWVLHLRDVARRHEALLGAVADEPDRVARLAALNVIRQVENVAAAQAVREAWRTGRSLSVHGWMYDVRDGMLADLGAVISSPGDVHPACAVARRALAIG